MLSILFEFSIYLEETSFKFVFWKSSGWFSPWKSILLFSWFGSRFLVKSINLFRGSTKSYIFFLRLVFWREFCCEENCLWRRYLASSNDSIVCVISFFFLVFSDDLEGLSLYWLPIKFLILRFDLGYIKTPQSGVGDGSDKIFMFWTFYGFLWKTLISFFYGWFTSYEFFD